MDAAEPGFADKFRTPDSPSQTALLTAGDSVVLELAKPGVPAKFIAYEMPADFVQDLQDDIAAIRAADSAMDSDDQGGVASTEEAEGKSGGWQTGEQPPWAASSAPAWPKPPSSTPS